MGFGATLQQKENGVMARSGGFQQTPVHSTLQCAEYTAVSSAPQKLPSKNLSVRSSPVTLIKECLPPVYLHDMPLMLKRERAERTLNLKQTFFNVFSELNPKKCRARYGLDRQEQWCKPCR